MMVHIDFEREDRQPFQFQNITGKVASFLINNDEYLHQFVHFIRNSYRFDAIKFHQYICRFQERISRKRVNGNLDDEYVSLLEELSTTCRKDRDVNDLRGMIAEQIFQECFKKRRLGRDWKYLTGCSVRIDGVLVIYTSETGTKMTVDLGAWCFNLQSGEFYEVKLSPYAFHKIDFCYLSQLNQSLKNAGISKYKIGIFSLDDSLLLRERIQQLGFEMFDQMQTLSLADFLGKGHVH